MREPFDIAAFTEEIAVRIGNQDGEARLFWKAFSYAVNAHQDQRRKSGEAYVSHPCEVVKILVFELGIKNPETLAAAMLHDTVEDVVEVTSEEIGALFGREVEAIVDGVTKIDGFEGDRQTFSKMVHRKLFSGAASRIETILVKLADRLHNMRTLDSMPQRKRQKIADETLDIYAPLARVLGLFKLKRELYDLALLYRFPRQAHRIVSRTRRYADDPGIMAVIETLRAKLSEAWITADVDLRVKGLWSYYDPLHKTLNRDTESPVEILIATTDVAGCYQVMGIMNQLYPPIPRGIRDFIANPKSTGYQCLHLRVVVGGLKYLVKIRTAGMLERGRSGIIAQWSSGRNQSDFSREIREMLKVMGHQDGPSYREVIAASSGNEIYAYTPRGDAYCLPNKSTVLDFAFKVHTDIGRRCLYGMVGDKKKGPEAILYDGDRVKIVCGEDSVHFTPDIQHRCQTPRARGELARMFRRRRRRLARRIGHDILALELKRYGVPKEILDHDGMIEVAEKFDLDHLRDLYVGIGRGRISLKAVVREIIDHLYRDRCILQPPTGALNIVFLDTLDPACVKFSGCCNPLPFEKGLYGLLNDRGLSVHRKDCVRIGELKIQREDVVQVRWKLKDTRLAKMQSLIFVDQIKRQRLMSMLSAAPREMRVSEIDCLAREPVEWSAWEIKFKVDDLHGLKKIMDHFSRAGIKYEFALEA